MQPVTAQPGSSPQLTAYVPRITIEWLRSAPETLGRELDGTMAFVDISGFTAMSERLASKGKEGAEEVNEVMNTTFGHLLHVAYTYGGSLLKFGGDALLLFFAGAGHERRAARAAYVMRRMLRSIGRPQTSVGSVTLRMHVGLNSGRFHFFLVGEAHRELIVSGPETGRTVALEDASEAGDILLSTATAAALPARVLGEKKGGGVLLRLEPAADPHGEPLPSVEGLDLSLGVPVAVRASVTAGTVEPEHRQAAIAFLRFSGLTVLLEQEGIDAAARAVHELVGAVQRAADEHGVTFLESDVDRDGGRIVLVAGAPQSAGEDEGRLLLTVRAIVDADTALPVAAGINRGRVFAGEVGAPFRRTYTVLGDTAALAARLMARAQPGQILVAAAVLERTRTRFETHELEPFTVKGKSRPVVAHELRGLARGRSAPAVRHLPLVDRQRELAILGASLAPARAGFGSLVELVGDTGIGKSRLVAEMREQSADMTVLTAACEPYDTSTAYGVFRELLRGLLDIGGDGDTARNSELLSERVTAIAPELRAWLPLLAVPLDLPVEPTRETDELDPAFRRARLHGVVGTLLQALLPNPTLLVFEDAHWMDGASSELLRHLGTEVTSRPWFALVTRHPTGQGFSAADGTPPLPALTMRLEPLPADDARALVAAAAETPLAAADVDAIVERAGGNALFLQELVAASGRTGRRRGAAGERRGGRHRPHRRALARRPGGAALGVRAGDALRRPPARRGARARGVRRRRRGLGSAGRVPRARPERRRRLPLPAGRVPGRRLRGALVPPAPRAAPPRGRGVRAAGGGGRPRVRRDALAALVARGRPRAHLALLAHRGRARTGEVRERRGGRLLPPRARGGTAPRRTSSRPRWPRVWESLGDVSELAGRYPEAVEAYRSGRRLAEPALGPQPGLLLKEGSVRERISQYSEALRWYTRGLAAAEGLADAAERRAHRTKLTLAYAGVRLRQGLWGDCIRRCRAALEDAQDAGDLRSTRPRLLPHAPRLHRAREPRPGGVPRARAADLRGARRPARPGERAQQPRDRRLLRRPLGRGARPLPAQPRGPRADRRRRRRRDDHEQHRRDRVRPGLPRRGGGRVPAGLRRLPRRRATR